MKKIILLFTILSTFAYSQIPPQGISHRGTVYNTLGALVTNADVKIKISILDGSASGSVVYTETHSAHTNLQGQYSLNIGTVTPSPTPSFSSINWSTNLKFLKVEIDPTNVGTTFPIVGTNQLMSVPYALYALNSQIKVFNNIIELKNAKGNLNDVVYIKGHSTFLDGGEGNFIWRELPIGNAALNHNNGTIVRDDSIGFGWVRIIEDKINVRFFGTSYDWNGPDQGVLIQKAIDYANQNALNYSITQTKKFRDYTNCGSTVFIPSGEYKIMGKLTLKYGVNIEGESMTSTILKADNSVYPNGTMVEIDGGQLVGVSLSNIFFDGNASVGDPATNSFSDAKNCIYIKAHQQTPVDTFANSGGVWLATFKNLSIRNFNGTGIILEGNGINSQTSAVDYSYPNQDILFDHVNIARQRDNSDCLLIRGQNGQLTFINCGFDGLLTNNRASKFFNVAIETNAVQPAVIKFLTCTFQYSEYGVITTYAESVTFDNCWFETLDVGVFATKASINNNASKCINIINSRFANASGFGTIGITNKNMSGGTCIAVEGNSNVNVQNNYVLTSDANYNNSNNYFIRNYGLDSKINASNNSFQNPSLGKTSGIANKIINISGNILNTFGDKFITVNCVPTTNTTNNIKEIISEISAGEMITIKATGVGQIKFDNTKNIIFAKSTTTSFTLLPKETATFMKVDSPIVVGSNTYNETYQLISFNKTY